MYKLNAELLPYSVIGDDNEREERESFDKCHNVVRKGRVLLVT
jgi:hypothetical protein